MAEHDAAGNGHESFLGKLKRRKKALLRELEELEIAEKIYSEFGLKTVEEPGKGSEAAARAANPSPSTSRRRRPSRTLNGHRYPATATPSAAAGGTMRDATVQLLSTAPPEGLSAAHLRSDLRESGWENLKTTSLASLLTRLKNEGVVDNVNRRWRLKNGA